MRRFEAGWTKGDDSSFHRRADRARDLTYYGVRRIQQTSMDEARSVASASGFRALLPPHPDPWGEGELLAALSPIQSASTCRCPGLSWLLHRAQRLALAAAGSLARFANSRLLRNRDEPPRQGRRRIVRRPRMPLRHFIFYATDSSVRRYGYRRRSSRSESHRYR